MGRAAVDSGNTGRGRSGGAWRSAGRAALRALFLLALAAPFLASGCASADVPRGERSGDFGTLTLALRAETGGVEYRLRNATITIAGPEVVELSTEDDPDALVHTVALAPGEYDLFLGDGWRLEREGPAGFEDVEAALVSANPRTVSVVSGEEASRAFDFLLTPPPPEEDQFPLPDVLGFEALEFPELGPLWSTSSATLALSSVRVQGKAAVSVLGGGYIVLTSIALPNFPVSENQVRLAVRLPTAQPNPYWFGTVGLQLNAPSVGLSNAYVGTLQLTGLPTGKFTDVTFTLPSTVYAALQGEFDDLSVRLIFNLPTGATQPLLVDNLRFGGTSACNPETCPGGTCKGGICELSCSAGWGDCDQDLESGCETSLDTSLHCGGCSLACSAGSLCVSGTCKATPSCSGRADCDGNSANACETDVLSNAANCGSCGNVCGAGTSCFEGACLGGDLTATVVPQSDWGSGYCANLRLKNQGTVATSAWKVVLDLRGHTLTSSWNAQFQSQNGQLIVKPVSFNAAIAPGATSADIGLCASRPTASKVLPLVVSVNP